MGGKSRTFEFQAQLRFYEELNDFLPPHRRKEAFVYRFNGNPSIKDAIEANGVPHSEVDLVIVNGRSVGFDHHLRDSDVVSVYPVFEGLDISPIAKLREEPLRRTAFVLDVHLGKLARMLRMLGFDVVYRTDYDDPEIVRISVSQKRTILTRDRRLLFAKVVTHGFCLRSQIPQEQLVEVLDRLDLYSSVKPFTRCMECNGMLREAPKAEVQDLLEPKTRLYYDEFHRCDTCGRIYWKGSHFNRLRRIADLATLPRRQVRPGNELHEAMEEL